jgi:hypothetical protein
MIVELYINGSLDKVISTGAVAPDYKNIIAQVDKIFETLKSAWTKVYDIENNKEFYSVVNSLKIHEKLLKILYIAMKTKSDNTDDTILKSWKQNINVIAQIVSDNCKAQNKDKI